MTAVTARRAARQAWVAPVMQFAAGSARNGRGNCRDSLPLLPAHRQDLCTTMEPPFTTVPSLDVPSVPLVVWLS